MHRVKVGGVTHDRNGIVRDDVDRNRIAEKVLRYKFKSHADAMVTVGLAWAWGNGYDQQRDLLRELMKSCAAVARYLRQPMTWVESLSLDELNRWSDVLSELLIAERGGTVDNDGPKDPWGLMRTDD